MNFSAVRPHTLCETFIKHAMIPSKRTMFEKEFNKALDTLRMHLIQSKSSNPNPMTALEEIVDKVSPLIKISTERRGAKNIQTPVPITQEDRVRIGVKWIMEASEKRKGKLAVRLSQEWIGVMEGDSTVLSKKVNVHKNALANRSNLIMTDRRVRR
jgi:ribosomal protein S7